MQRLMESIVRILATGESVVVATILSHAGSTPRTSGARMLIRADGSIEGTVGGGLVEAEIMRTGLTMMASPGTLVRSYDLRFGSAGETLDMLCGGRLEVLLESLAPTPEPLRFYRQVAEALAHGRRGLTVTALPDAGIASGGITKWWADRHGVRAGRLA